MKIRVNKQEFLRTLKTVSKAITENKIRPVISGVYMEAKDSKITLKGTNLELTVTSNMDGEIIESGNLVFSHQLVEEYLREINDVEVTLSIDDKTLLIETEDSSSEFTVFDAEEYPRIKSFQGGEQHTLPIELFIELLEKAKFSAAQTGDNIAINSVRIELKDKLLKLISTDTYRLVYVSSDVELDGNLEVSVPLKSIEAIIKILVSKKSEDVTFVYEGNQMKFIIGETEVLTRVIDLPFPDYNGILNTTGYNKEVLIDSVEFKNVLKRVQIFVRNNNESKNSGIFEFNEGTLEVKGVSEIAKINETIEIEKTGDNLKISLNVKFLLDYLSFIEKGKKVFLRLSTSSGAVQLTTEGSDDFKYLVMPLALKD
ncbi:MAG: DNA polymerase III subunit beta [Psychrilyobacter sp.]|nr:DNA polymerase III subunit beta [Psychrilyobacter sp.]